MPRPQYTPDGDRWLSSGKVAEILNVSTKTATRWAKEGKLPYTKTMGGHRRYRETDIRRLQEDLRGPTSEEAAAARGET